jgi:adenylyl-sulfate kinase
MDAQTGFIIWVTGMKGAGKSALSRFVHRKLALAGHPAELIDADDPDEILTKGLGETKEDRDIAVRRVGHVAKMLARRGAAAVCASLSPHREARETLRREARRFVEVFVDCPIEVLHERDPIYRKAMASEAKDVPGIDVPYEPPTHAEVTVQTDRETVEIAGARVFQALVDLKYIAPAEFGRLTGGQREALSHSCARKLADRAGARKAPKKATARTANAGRRPRRAGDTVSAGPHGNQRCLAHMARSTSPGRAGPVSLWP